MNSHWMTCVGAALMLISGCQCCPLFDCYANTIDDLNDHHIYFDRFYNPKCDISRIGRPDWNSPFKSWFCPRCTTNGCYDRYDDCNLYPPLYPFQFPSNVMPPPTIRHSRIPRAYDFDDNTSETVPPAPGTTSNPPAPGSTSSPPVPGNSSSQ